MATAPEALHDIRKLGAWSRGLLIAQSVIGVLMVVAALQFGPGFYNEAGGSMAYFGLLMLQFLILLPSAFLFLRWTYRTNANVQRLGAQGVGSPRWAVGWYFVPIACLGMPLVALKEIWKASIAPRDWEIAKASPLLGWWWLFWLVSNFASLIAWRLDTDDRLEGAASYAETLTMIGDASLIPASLLLATIVSRLTALQSAYLAMDPVVAPVLSARIRA